MQASAAVESSRILNAEAMPDHDQSPTFVFLNAAHNQDTTALEKITLKVPPQTDIFASPTIGYHFSAPIIYTPIPIHDFQSTIATFTLPVTALPPNPTLHFDQCGLIFVLRMRSTLVASKELPGDKRTHPKWIKAGIEVIDGKAWGSVVVRQKWSDWSLFELEDCAVEKGYKIKMALERSGDALMVYAVFETESGAVKKLVRKVPWVWIDEEVEGVEEALVGVYGARPDAGNQSKGQNLEAEIEDLVIKCGDGMRVIN